MDDTTVLSGSGSAIVFERSLGWQQGVSSTLTAGTSAGNFELFGSSVAISGDTVVVGAPRDGSLGEAYVFVGRCCAFIGLTWTRQALSRSTVFLAGFGSSVAIDGNQTVVGSPDGSTFFGEGIAQIFTRSGATWSEEAVLFGPTSGKFGTSVAISADTVVVGAPRTDLGSAPQDQDAGTAYVSMRRGSSWSSPDSVTASDSSGRSEFGTSVAASAGTVVVGAPLANTWTGVDTGTDTGSAYAIAANDDFNSSVSFAGTPFTRSSSTVDATTVADDPVCAGAGHSVWYRFIAPTTGTVIATTMGSDFDTTLSAYTGSRGSLTHIACNDDFFGYQSRIEFPVSAGTTYYLMVASFGSSPGGNLTLHVG